jgi:hypothetical protein
VSLTFPLCTRLTAFSPKSKAAAINSRQLDQAIEEHYASHKKSQRIKQQLDRLNPKDLNNQTEIASRLKRKVSHDIEAAKFQKLADEQIKKSKAVQIEVDELKDKGEKEYIKAKNELLERQTACEAPLLKAKSRLYADLGKSLEGTMYGRATASDSDSSCKSFGDSCQHDIDASANRDNAVPRPKKSPALDRARKTNKRQGKEVYPPSKKPSGGFRHIQFELDRDEREARDEDTAIENPDGGFIAADEGIVFQ